MRPSGQEKDTSASALSIQVKTVQGAFFFFFLQNSCYWHYSKSSCQSSLLQCKSQIQLPSTCSVQSYKSSKSQEICLPEGTHSELDALWINPYLIKSGSTCDNFSEGKICVVDLFSVKCQLHLENWYLCSSFRNVVVTAQSDAACRDIFVKSKPITIRNHSCPQSRLSEPEVTCSL